MCRVRRHQVSGVLDVPVAVAEVPGGDHQRRDPSRTAADDARDVVVVERAAAGVLEIEPGGGLVLGSVQLRCLLDVLGVGAPQRVHREAERVAAAAVDAEERTARYAGVDRFASVGTFGSTPPGVNSTP